MASLAELLSRDVPQTLGISGTLAREQQRAARAGQAQVQVAGIEAQAELRRQEEARRREEERKRKKAGFFSTLGTILGGAAGLLIPGGSLALAGAGARLGGAAGGVVGGDASRGTELAMAGFDALMQHEQAEEAKKIAQKAAEGKAAKTAAEITEIESQVGLNLAKTKQLLEAKSEKGKLPPKAANIAKQASVGFNILKKEIDKLLANPKKLTGKLLEKEFGKRFAGDQAKILKAALSNTLDGIIRFRTGAVVNESEMVKYVEDFGPKAGDSVDVIKFKMNQLNAMIKVMNGEEVTGEEDLWAQTGFNSLDTRYNQLKDKSVTVGGGLKKSGQVGNIKYKLVQ